MGSFQKCGWVGGSPPKLRRCPKPKLNAAACRDVAVLNSLTSLLLLFRVAIALGRSCISSTSSYRFFPDFVDVASFSQIFPFLPADCAFTLPFSLDPDSWFLWTREPKPVPPRQSHLPRFPSNVAVMWQRPKCPLHTAAPYPSYQNASYPFPSQDSHPCVSVCRSRHSVGFSLQDCWWISQLTAWCLIHSVPQNDVWFLSLFWNFSLALPLFQNGVSNLTFNKIEYIFVWLH